MIINVPAYIRDKKLHRPQTGTYLRQFILLVIWGCKVLPNALHTGLPVVMCGAHRTAAATSISITFPAASVVFFYPLSQVRVSPTLCPAGFPQYASQSSRFSVSEIPFSCVHPHRSPSDISGFVCVTWVNRVATGRLWIGLETSKWWRCANGTMEPIRSSHYWLLWTPEPFIQSVEKLWLNTKI